MGILRPYLFLFSLNVIIHCTKKTISSYNSTVRPKSKNQNPEILKTLYEYQTGLLFSALKMYCVRVFFVFFFQNSTKSPLYHSIEVLSYLSKVAQLAGKH